jgi:hypothetical protein
MNYFLILFILGLFCGFEKVILGQFLIFGGVFLYFLIGNAYEAVYDWAVVNYEGKMSDILWDVVSVILSVCLSYGGWCLLRCLLGVD